jgi:hypothetical protein
MKPYYKFITIICLIVYVILIENDVLARSYFKMTVPKMTFGLTYDFENEERTGPNFDREDSTHSYTEQLMLSTRGWVYHPELVSFTLQLRPRWSQSIEKFSTGDKDKSRSFSFGINSNVAILKSKPYSFTLFANTGNSTVSGSFAGRSRSETSSYGANMNLTKLWLPGSIRYLSSESKQTGRFDINRENEIIDFNVKYDKYAGVSILNALYRDVRTTFEGRRTDNLTKNVRFSNNYNLKSNGITGGLRSGLTFDDAEGSSFKLTRYDISENLNLHHRGNLSTNYIFNYNFTEREASKSQNGRLGFTLRHKLYENLNTTVRAGTRRSESSGTENLDYEGGVRFGYSRRIPWGKLGISVGQNYRQSEVSKKDEFVEVSDESVLLTTGEITLLKKSFIDVGTIRVMDPSRITEYPDDGTHYTLVEENDRVLIRCVTGGLIDTDFDCSDGASVVVDYTYRSQGVDYAFYSRSYGLSLNLWSFLKMYYRFSRSTRRSVSSFVSIEPVRNEARTIGAEISLKNTKTSFKYSIKDPSGVPTEGIVVKEGVTFRPSRNIFLSLSGSFSQTRFMTEDRKDFFKGMRGNMQMIISRRSRLTISGFGDQGTGDSIDNLRYGFSVDYRIRFRRLRAGMTYSFSDYRDDINFQSIKNHSFTVNVKTVSF